MTKQEKTDHCKAVTADEVEDYMEVTYTIRNTKLVIPSTAKVHRFFRSNIPIDYVEEMIIKNSKEDSHPNETVFPSSWEYQDDIQVVRYLKGEDMPKTAAFLNKFEKLSMREKILKSES